MDTGELIKAQREHDRIMDENESRRGRDAIRRTMRVIDCPALRAKADGLESMLSSVDFSAIQDAMTAEVIDRALTEIDARNDGEL